MDDATLPDQAQIYPLTLRFRDRGLEAGFRAARAGATFGNFASRYSSRFPSILCLLRSIILCSRKTWSRP